MNQFFPLTAGVMAAVLGLSAPVRAQLPSWQWVATQTRTSTGTSYAIAAAPDGAGNTVVAGHFYGTITLGSTTLTSTGPNDDVFVGRVNSAGTWTQAVSGGGTASDFVKAVAVDGAGNVTVVGNFFGPQTAFGGTVLNQAPSSGTSRNDIFVARLSSAGVWTQAVRAGGPGVDEADDVALDANGDAVVVGHFDSATAYFGAQALTNGAAFSSTTYDGFVARLSSNGTWTQAVRCGGPGSDFADAVTLDPSGTACVAGRFSSDVAGFGTLTVANSAPGAQTSDVFVARLNRAGTWLQAAAGGSTGFDYATDVALEANGAATVVGNFGGPTARFGAQVLTNSDPGAGGTSSADIYVARLSSSGVWTLAAAAGGPDNHDYAQAVAVDAAGNAAVAGYIRSAVARFGATSLTNFRAPSNPIGTTFSADLYVAHCTNAGTWGYVAQAGSYRDDQANAVLVAADGSVTVAGDIGLGTVAFGPISVVLNRSTGFVARLGSLATATRRPSLATVAVFPNPAHEAVALRWPANVEAHELLILNALGREVRRLPLGARSTAATVSLNDLPPGLYTVSVGALRAKLLVD